MPAPTKGRDSTMDPSERARAPSRIIGVDAAKPSRAVGSARQGKIHDDLVFMGPTPTRCDHICSGGTLTTVRIHRCGWTAPSRTATYGRVASNRFWSQRQGHKSATMTVDPYGHLFAHQLDEVAEAMDIARVVAG